MNAPPVTAPVRPDPMSAGRSGRRWGAWVAVVPLLAVLAYAPVVGVGFLSDDFALLLNTNGGWDDWGFLLPNSLAIFYRPVGLLLTWRLGRLIWGLDPLPYHLIGLALHAIVAGLLVAWLVALTDRRRLAWGAGALFAVFPLHLEALAWLSAQWDVWAAAFGLGSLWAFTRWWRGGGLPLYLIAGVMLVLGLLSKESLLAFLPLYAVVGWFLTPRLDRSALRRLGGALLPFTLVVASYLGLRFAVWGGLGGYGARINDAGTLWTNGVAFARLLLAPINAIQLGVLLPDVVAVVSAVGLAGALVRWGWGQRRVLLLATAWLGCTLAPVLALPPKVDDLQQNRFFYLIVPGYCILLTALMDAAWAGLSTRRQRVVGAAGLLALLGSGALCWVQLQPWQVATAQAQAVEAEVYGAVPLQTRDPPTLWYMENLPDNYQGAYIFRNGLNVTRFFTTGRLARIRRAAVAEAPLVADPRDAFALRFAYDEATQRYHLDAAAGVTGDRPAEVPDGVGLHRWDFRDCTPGALARWTVAGAPAACTPGAGLAIPPTAPPAQVIGPAISLLPAPADGVLVRLRVAVRYAAGIPAGTSSTWDRRGPDGTWQPAASRPLPLTADGQEHVYWSFVPAATVGPAPTTFRFTPASLSLPVQIAWVAIDEVP